MDEKKALELLTPFRTPFDPAVESHTLPVYRGAIEVSQTKYGRVFDLTLYVASEDGTEDCFVSAHNTQERAMAVLALWRACPELVYSLSQLTSVTVEG